MKTKREKPADVLKFQSFRQTPRHQPYQLGVAAMILDADLMGAWERAEPRKRESYAANLGVPMRRVSKMAVCGDSESILQWLLKQPKHIPRVQFTKPEKYVRRTKEEREEDAIFHMRWMAMELPPGTSAKDMFAQLNRAAKQTE